MPRLSRALAYQIRLEFIAEAQLLVCMLLDERRARGRPPPFVPHQKRRLTRLAERLAERYGLSERSIRDLVSGRTWVQFAAQERPPTSSSSPSATEAPAVDPDPFWAWDWPF